MSGNKRYGHAIGKTNGEVGLTQTTYKSRANPLVDFAPGTKAPSEGEPYTFAMASRVFAETWRSLELLSGVLDTPAVRVDRIEAYNGTYGTNALSGLAVGASAPSFSSGTAPVVAWIYHGLYKSELSRFLKLSKSKTQADLDYADVVSPSDVIIPGLSSSVFPAGVVSQGSTFHGIPSYVAPMRRVRSLVAPYSGGELAVAIDSWETDGCRITTREWDEIYARPGVFVEVTGAGANNGLWQIAQIAYDEGTASGGKAVLVRGGLHKFTLDAPLALGSRISWSVQPNEALSGLGSNKHYGVVAYVLGDDHYVLEASASEQMPVPGLGALGLNALGAAAGRSSTGRIGSIDVESGNDRNRTVVAGTVVTDSAGTTANITAVIMAREPVVFDPDSTVGSFYLVSPLGFSLSPQLVVDNSIGGDYNLDCFTLTTVGEQLLSQAGVAQGEVENPAYEQGFTRSERTLILQALKHFKAGTASATSPMDSPNGSFAPPAMVLGEQRWRVTMSNITDADTFETHVPAGTVVEFSSLVLGANKVKALVVSAQDNEVILSEVRHDLNGGFAPESVGGTSIVGQPLAAAVYPFGSYVVVAGRTFVVSAITVRPEMDNAAGGTTLPNPSLLTNLYRNLFSSAAALRTSNHGKWLLMDDGNPLELYLSATGSWQSGVRVWGSVDDYDALSARDQSSANTNHTLQLQVDRDGGVVLGTDPSYPAFYLGEASAFATPGAVTKQVRFDFAGGVLGFADQNTGLGSVIPFSEASPFNALPPGTTSLLGSITQLTQSGTVGAEEYAVISPSLIYAEGGVPVVPGHTLTPQGGVTFDVQNDNATVNVSAGAPTLSNGDVIRILSLDADNIPSYEYHQVADDSGLPASFVLSDRWAGATQSNVSDWAVVTDPLQVTVKAGAATILGVRHEWPDTDLVATVGATSHVCINSLGAPTILATPLVQSTLAASVGVVAANAYAVTTVTPVAIRCAALDQHTDIYVGKAGGVPISELYGQGSHFDTIGDAFKAIESWQDGGLSRQSRAWRIFVMGDCVEADALDKGVTLPLRVPADNVKIAGVQGAGASPKVSWAVQSALFDVNGKTGFCLEGVAFSWTGAYSPGASRVVNAAGDTVLVADTLSRGGALGGLVLKDIYAENCGLLYLHDSDSLDVSILNAWATGVPDTAVYARTTGGGTCSLSLSKVRIESSASSVSAESASMVSVDSITNVVLKDVVVTCGSSVPGIGLYGSITRASVRDCSATVTDAAALRVGASLNKLDGDAEVLVEGFLADCSNGAVSCVYVNTSAGTLGSGYITLRDMSVINGVTNTGSGYQILAPRTLVENCRFFTGPTEDIGSAFHIGAADVVVRGCSALVTNASGYGYELTASALNARIEFSRLKIAAGGTPASGGVSVNASATGVRIHGCNFNTTDVRGVGAAYTISNCAMGLATLGDGSTVRNCQTVGAITAGDSCIVSDNRVGADLTTGTGCCVNGNFVLGTITCLANSYGRGNYAAGGAGGGHVAPLGANSAGL